tara:strand:+ start:16769 stop:17422 length:654 start_codon:yes stop_codon:yes gene_type:complete
MNITLRITGITRMSGERICISGYDAVTNKYYRPILENGYLTSSFLNQNPEHISIFSLVTFEYTHPISNPVKPHIEDLIISENIIKIENDLNTVLDQNNFLSDIADHSIEQVFGSYMDVVDNHHIVFDGYGKRSLGTIISPKCTVTKDSNNNTRVSLIDQTGFQLSNVKCVSYDNKYCIPGNYQNIPIRISLSRRWKRPSDDEFYYWVQISGIFPLNR